MENKFIYKNDLPDSFLHKGSVAIDTETMGLIPARDRLCVLQISSGDKKAHLVQFTQDSNFSAPNLKKLLKDESVLKIFHFARFDVSTIYKNLGVVTSPCYCTKIASKLTRTYTDHHGLRELCNELLGVKLNKQQQSSDWGKEILTPEQVDYAASDVLFLHRLKEKLDLMLEREGRIDMATACFEFLKTQIKLDILGWQGDIFAHH